MASATTPTASRKLIVWICEDSLNDADDLEKRLGQCDDVAAVSIFHSAETLLGALEGASPLPDVGLIDIRLPGLSGFQLLERLREKIPTMINFVHSEHSREEIVRTAIVAGAAGFLLKDDTSGGIESAVAASARGELWNPIDPRVARFLLPAAVAADDSGTPARIADLTKREREVLIHVCDGLLTKEIAALLGLTEYGVTRHLRGIYDKLEVRNRAGAVAVALRCGLAPGG